MIISWSFIIDQDMVLSTFVSIGKFLKDVRHIIWNELSYSILYLSKVYIFLWYFNEIKLYTKNIQPKIPFGRCDSGGCERHTEIPLSELHRVNYHTVLNICFCNVCLLISGRLLDTVSYQICILPHFCQVGWNDSMEWYTTSMSVLW